MFGRVGAESDTGIKLIWRTYHIERNFNKDGVITVCLVTGILNEISCIIWRWDVQENVV